MQKHFMAVHSVEIDMHPVLVGWDNVEVDIGVNRREGNIKLGKRAGILKVCGLDKEERKFIRKQQILNLWRVSNA